MKEKSVVVEIDEQGNSTIDLEGFQGKGCTDVAKAFQGHDVVKTSRSKPDFYIQEIAPKRQQQS
jgi:hypothetical protein